MRLFRSFYTAIGLMIGHVAVGVIGFVINTFKNVFDAVSPYMWRATEKVKLIAVRLIGKLKPIYLNSWQTDGQSLDPHWRSC